MNQYIHESAHLGKDVLIGRNVVIEEKTMGIQGDFRGSEWTGVNFSPDGKWLFVNIQSPGFTAAITGPWAKGFL